MQIEDMGKYGVELDDGKTKTADNKPVNACPWCRKELDRDGTCPDHGTEPFEAVRED